MRAERLSKNGIIIRFAQQIGTHTEIERELDMFFKRKSKPMSFDTFTSAVFTSESKIWIKVRGLE